MDSKWETIHFGLPFYGKRTSNLNLLWRRIVECSDMAPRNFDRILFTLRMDDEDAPTIRFGDGKDPYGKKCAVVISLAFTIGPHHWFEKQSIRAPKQSDWNRFQAAFTAWFIPSLLISWKSVGKRLLLPKLNVAEMTIFASESENGLSRGIVRQISGSK